MPCISPSYIAYITNTINESRSIGTQISLVCKEVVWTVKKTLQTLRLAQYLSLCSSRCLPYKGRNLKRQTVPKSLDKVTNLTQQTKLDAIIIYETACQGRGVSHKKWAICQLRYLLFSMPVNPGLPRENIKNTNITCKWRIKKNVYEFRVDFKWVASD